MTWQLIIFALVSGLVANALTAFEMRKIRQKDGIVDSERVLRTLDITIVVLVSILMQICFMDQGVVTMLLAGAFGAFLASAAWSDAKSGFVPDVSIIPAFVFGCLLSWSAHMGHAPNLITALCIVLLGLCIFGLLILAYLHLSFVRITPPDAVFVMLILMAPTDLPQMIVVLVLIIVMLLLVKTRPDLVRALIPETERNHLTSQMEEALGAETGYMEQQGWYPLGPVVLVCILAGHCINHLL